MSVPWLRPSESVRSPASPPQIRCPGGAPVVGRDLGRGPHSGAQRKLLDSGPATVRGQADGSRPLHRPPPGGTTAQRLPHCTRHLRVPHRGHLAERAHMGMRHLWLEGKSGPKAGTDMKCVRRRRRRNGVERMLKRGCGAG